LEWVRVRGQPFVYANVYQTSDIVKICLAEKKVVQRWSEEKMLQDSATY
jgi:glutamine cyclotransferase